MYEGNTFFILSLDGVYEQSVAVWFSTPLNGFLRGSLFFLFYRCFVSYTVNENYGELTFPKTSQDK